MFIKIDTREQDLFNKCQNIIEAVPKFKDIKLIPYYNQNEIAKETDYKLTFICKKN